MRITLVIPPDPGYLDCAERLGDKPIEFLGLGYVAAVARENGYPVDILDCKFEALDYEQAVRRIQAQSPQVVGITAPWFLVLTSAVKLSRRLREAGYDGLIVLGGHSATFTFQNLLSQFPTIDVVVRGEGEFTFLELLQRLDEGGDWRQVPGIAYRENGQVVTTGMRPLMKDLDALPWPARDNVATDGVPSSLLFSRSRGLVPSTVILSSRGCPFNCTFCSVHAFYSFSDGSKWRPRSAKSVVDEMTHMVEKWGVQHFVFGDDNVVGSCPKGRARVREMASLLIERNLGIKFNMECCVTDVELSLFSLLRKAGLAQVHLGIESGVPRTLKSFNKPTTVEQNKRAISMLRKLNIDYFPNFILVDPDTTLEELGQSLAFFKESGIYRASQAIYMLYSSRLALFAGTAAFEHYRKAGRTRPLNTLRLTEEEQSIAAATGMSLGYEMKDPRVARFLDLFPRVISELTRRSDDLMRLEEQCRPHAAGTLRLENWPGFLASVGGWRANANTLALRLFEQALTLIEQGAINDETVEQHVEELVSEIDRCDVRHFGKTVNELAHATSMELSGAGIGR